MCGSCQNTLITYILVFLVLYGPCAGAQNGRASAGVHVRQHRHTPLQQPNTQRTHRQLASLPRRSRAHILQRQLQQQQHQHQQHNLETDTFSAASQEQTRVDHESGSSSSSLHRRSRERRGTTFAAVSSSGRAHISSSKHRRSALELGVQEPKQKLLEGQTAAYKEDNPPVSAENSLPRYNSSCGPICNQFGTCNEEIRRCDCPKQRMGRDCSQMIKDTKSVCQHWAFKPDKCFSDELVHCMNQCNFRGKCDAGFCKCKPGFYGADCSLSLDAHGKPELLAGQGYVPRKTGPRIYVYELPPSNNMWPNLVRNDRPIMHFFWKRLLAAGVRVADGEQADYYFVPFLLRNMMQGGQLQTAVEHIRQHWPWWDRWQGARHLFIQSGDMGRAEVPRASLDLTANSTWLTYWGLYHDHSFSHWPAAHRPGLDIVMPVMMVPRGALPFTPLHPGMPQPERNGTLFFAGRICGGREDPLHNNLTCIDPNAFYSAGTRLKVFQHHQHREGYKIAMTSETYGHDMTSYRYCLAPTGGGHGKRNVLTALMGCIPITVTDNVSQPFEPEMRWSDFSIPLPEADIPRLHEIIDAVTPEQYAQYQEKLMCAAQHLFFSSSMGAILGDNGRYDAFETIMAILAARLRHPGVDPGSLAELDPELKSFFACDLGSPYERPRLCTHHGCPEGCENQKQLPLVKLPEYANSVTCSKCRAKPHYAQGSNLLYNAWPGSPACCETKKVAQCPRAWS